MQLSHSRKRRPFRGDSSERSAGVALVEAAFISPLFFMLVLGIMELGLAMNDNLALGNTVRAGSRVASASGADLLADYGIIQAVKRESSALPRGQIQRIIVYRATEFGASPSLDCRNGLSNGNTASGGFPCNVYDTTDFGLSKDKWGCKTNGPDATWCPNRRKVTLSGTGPEYIGVWMQIKHPWLTRMFGSEVILTDKSVIRLEPRMNA
jgi:hypothetical protein